jgi:ribose-phosphate pyrophosphokinase
MLVGLKEQMLMQSFLNVDLALCYKQRKKANEISDMTIIGDVKGKRCCDN